MGEREISVIVPMHNAEATIERALRSILEQKGGKNFEVIVADDQSSDQSPELVKKFPVRLIPLPRNLGAGGARNQGAKAANGKILVFVDADVCLEPDALLQIENFFDRHPEFAGLAGNYTALPADRNLCSVYHNFFTVYHHDLSREEIEWFWGALSAIRKEVFEKLSGFSEQYPGASAEDLELGYRLSEAGYKIRYFPELRGTHARKFQLGDMLYNDYHKSVLGIKLYLKRKPRGIHPHGFSRPLNGINLMLAPLSLLALLAWPWAGVLPGLLLLLIFFGINSRFYRQIRRKAGFQYFFPAFFLHWLSFNVIAGGVIAGLIGLLLGKGLESRSRWI